jgi:hypothetical protein
VPDLGCAWAWQALARPRMCMGLAHYYVLAQHVQEFEKVILECFSGSCIFEKYIQILSESSARNVVFQNIIMKYAV